MAKLTTPYIEKMDAEHPHSYHPTPQFKRNAFYSLNGKWDFCLNLSSDTANYTETILVPFPPESSLSGVEKNVLPEHYMHYRKRFTLPDSFDKKKVFLHFGAVDQIAKITLNGHMLGEHEGGYIPFSFDVTDSLCEGENELLVTAKDSLDHKYPYGKQKYDRGGMWYTPVSGIWQTVWLEARPWEYVEDIKITPYEKGVKITVTGGCAHKKITLTESGEVFEFDGNMSPSAIFGYAYGSFLLEVTSDVDDGILVGTVTDTAKISYNNEEITLQKLLSIYENKLEGVFKCNIPDSKTPMENFSYKAESYPAPAIKVAKPKVLIPVFPGTNCEFDSAKVMRDAGAEPEIFVINNLSKDGISRSVETFAEKVKNSQMIFVPGGFSGGDEPDGSGKFITAFFRNAAIKEQVTDLLDNRDGLMCGICNGFQALIKLGLVPFGKIIDTDENCPTLTFNTIGRHQSRIVRTRIASNKSPWLADTNVGDIYNVPISHGEGRFLASEELIKELAKNGQIATQYVDLDGNATSDVHFNPNDSMYAIEGITSPDGRVFGKMGHSERVGNGLYKNVLGDYDIKMFKSAVKYFK